MTGSAENSPTPRRVSSEAGARTAATGLDPDLEEMRRLGHLAVDRAVEHLAGLADARVLTRTHPSDLTALVREPLPRAGLGVDSSIERLFDGLMPHATLVNHPRFFAYIPGPGSFVGALGSWLAAATNTFVGTWLGGAVMAQLEVEVLDWLREAMGLPASLRHGILTTGGSMANLGALAAARGSRDLALATVYVSEETHYSAAKAARVLGVRADAVRTVAVDDGLRMRVDALAAALEGDRAKGLEPMAVVATAGTTNTGAIDPLQDIAELCAQQELWFHVDAAYGAAACIVDELRAAFAGIERADSVTLDPHKWFYAPFECGCLLTRHPDALRAAFDADGTYMQDVPRDRVNFFERGPELTRGNRALPLWMLLRSQGIDALAHAVQRDVALCRLAADLLGADPRVHIVSPPQLSVFAFEVDGGEPAGRKLFDDLATQGFALLSSTRIAGRFAMRWCVANHRTSERDVRETVTHVLSLLD